MRVGPRVRGGGERERGRITPILIFPRRGGREGSGGGCGYLLRGAVGGRFGEGFAAGFGVEAAGVPFFPELPLLGAALLQALFEALLEALLAGGGYALAASFFEPFLDVVGEYHECPP